MKKNMQKLRDIILSEELFRPPETRKYHGDWLEVIVAIGNDHVGYITLPAESLLELVKLTSVCEDES